MAPQTPLALALVLLPLLALATPVQAAAAGCALPNPTPVRVPTPFLVPPPFPNALAGSCTVAGVLSPPGPVPPVQTGLQFTSGTAPCPPLPFIGALAGEFCGPQVPGLATITCTAAWTGNPNPDDKRALVVGLDFIVPLTADGNVVQPLPVDHEPLRYEGPSTNTVFSVRITNPLPVAARVIAYPVDGPFSSGTPVAVGCV
jgi:hypothetical protein